MRELVRDYDERPNWTFVYLGAGHESIEADASMRPREWATGGDNAMRWTHDPASTRKSMHSLADATDQHRRSAALKSERFFEEAGQSPADYQHVEPAHPQPPPEPQHAEIHRRSLGDVLHSSQQRDTEPGDGL